MYGSRSKAANSLTMSATKMSPTINKASPTTESQTSTLLNGLFRNFSDLGILQSFGQANHFNFSMI